MKSIGRVLLSATPWSVAASFLHPWNSPGKNTGVGCHFLLQGIFPTQGLNLGLLHCKQTLYHLCHHRSHRTLHMEILKIFMCIYVQDLLELTPQKNALFIIRDWNAKVGSQETPGTTGKFGLGIRNEAGQRLIEFCQENALVIANTLFQQHKRRLYTWTSSDGQH